MVQQFDLVGIDKVNSQQYILTEAFGHYEPVCESCKIISEIPRLSILD